MRIEYRCLNATVGQSGSTNGTMLCGAHSEAFIIHNGHKVSVMECISNRAAVPLFPLPAELHNQIISLNEVAWSPQNYAIAC